MADLNVATAPATIDAALVSLTEAVGLERARGAGDAVGPLPRPGARAALGAILERAEALAARLAEVTTLEAETGSEARSWRDPSGRPLSPRTLLEIADVASAVQAEWRFAHQRLWRAPRQGIEAELAGERAWSRVASGAQVLRRAVMPAVGRAPSDTTGRALDSRDLEARRLLAHLGRWIERADGHRGPMRRLRSAGTALAWLIGHRKAGTLSEVDRLEARRLRSQVRALARRPPSDADVSRVLAEVSAFASAGRATYRRRLAVHDDDVICSVVDALAARPSGAAMPCDVIARLATIEGRDSVLDDLLAGGADVSSVLARLLCLHAEVCRSSIRRPGLRAPTPASSGPGFAVGAA